MQPPILSCLCVTYNRPEFHEFLLWNFNKQTSRDIELIVVDGSTRSYADRFRQDRVRYIYLQHQPNIPVKRNLAMDNATAPYIAWFDDDDWQHPRRCEFLLAQLKNGAALTGCNSSFFYNVQDGSIKTYSGSQILFNSLGVERKIACATRFREDCLKASDNEWCRQIFSKTRQQTVILKSDPLFFWLSHGKNISNPSAKIRGSGRGAADSRVTALIGGEQETFMQLLGQIAAGDSAAEADPGAPKPEPEKPAAASEPRVFKADISVVVAVRNRSGYRVENFLKTLRRQAHLSGEVEIVLVDSASSPDHFESLWHLAKAHRATLIRLAAEHPWNKSLALNVGIRAATRRYVFLTDIDMIFQANFIAAALHALEQHHGKVVLHCQSRDLPPHAVKDATDVIAGFDALLAQSRWHTRLGNGACFITTREWLHKVRGMDEAYGQWGAMDRDISMRAQWDGLPVVWLENTSFLHQWHVGKQALWRHDPAIRSAWDTNHRRYSNYLKAAERRQPLADQIVRNPESWGEMAAGVFLEQGEVRKSLSQMKPPKAAAAPPAQTVAMATPPPAPKQPGTAGKTPPAAAFPGKVALAFNACPADADTLELIIPHVIRQCGYPFARKLLYSDRSAPAGKYAGKRHFHIEKYDLALNRLRENRQIDAVHECDGLQEAIRPFLAGDFAVKSHAGSPTLSYLASMLLPEADYILRMDSDILFYRAPGFDWISEGIRRMEADEHILFFMATPGPFTENLRRMRSFRRDVSHAGGILHYSSVTTRYFLFKKSRLATYCRQQLAPGRQRLEIALGELCAANRLKRVCLYSPKAWHLHTNASQWASQSPAALDKLIDCVERNHIHASQIGEYDLTPQWRNELVLSN